MSNDSHDRWLLPRQQTDCPTRDFLPEATLHGRREATYLVLAAMFLVTTAALILFEPTRVIDVSAVLPSVKLPIAMLLPVGVIPFALSFFAITLACELYGRRRATALMWVGLFAILALVGYMRLADAVDRRNTFASSLAFAGGYAVAHVGNVLVFDALRRRARGRNLWLRLNGSLVLAQLAGWIAFGVVHVCYARSVGGTVELSTLRALAIGSAAYTIVCVAVFTIPLLIVARSLALFLRTDRVPHAEISESRIEVVDQPRSRRLPAAVIVDSDYEVEQIEVPRRRRARVSIQPFSSAEMQFFSDGDKLTD